MSGSPIPLNCLDISSVRRANSTLPVKDVHLIENSIVPVASSSLGHSAARVDSSEHFQAVTTGTRDRRRQHVSRCTLGSWHGGWFLVFNFVLICASVACGNFTDDK